MNLEVRGRSAHSPQLQFITGLPDSPKTEAKGVVFVESPWYETSRSPGLPFDLNQSLTFPYLSRLDGSCTSLGRLYFDMLILSELFVGGRRRDRFAS